MPDRIPPTGKLAEGFYVLNQGFVASYLLDAGDGLIAFDTGMNPRRAAAETRKLGLDPGSVRAVFFTHADGDHIGGMGAFPAARPYFSEDEVAMFTGVTPRFFGRIYAKPVPFAYETLEDGRRLLMGNASISCILSPGHTAGSMSFLINDAFLVVGDELNVSDGRAVLDRNFISIDRKRRLESIRNLARLEGVRLLCPAHSGFSADFARAMEAWRA